MLEKWFSAVGLRPKNGSVCSDMVGDDGKNNATVDESYVCMVKTIITIISMILQ